MATTEQRALQITTVVAIIAITYLFIKQHIIAAMIVGVILLGLQRAYIKYFKKPNSDA